MSQNTQLLGAVPLWGICAGAVCLFLLSIAAGFVLGAFRRRAPHEAEGPLGTVVGASLGLLAFMLSFTFGMAASRFDNRRLQVIEDATSIGTTYLRADLLPEPQRAAARALLREYVDVRLEAVSSGVIEPKLAKVEELQDRLWAHAATLGRANPQSIMVGLFTQSLNEMIDLHARRVAVALRSPIPDVIWLVLGFLSVLAMATMGYQEGLSGKFGFPAVLALTLAFAAVMLLIADLDRPQQGLLRVSQQAMVDVQAAMKKSAP